MRGSKKNLEAAAWVEYVPPHDASSLNLGELFPPAAPLELDLGCGDGSFLAAMAAEYPGRNFIGVERMIGRVRSACRRIAARRLMNARILRVDIGQAVGCLMPEASVDVCHVMFPDPWPKRRHHRRRTVTSEFLSTLVRVLVPGGVVRLTTDDAPYFEQMQLVAAAVPELSTVANEDPSLLPVSTFQNRFVARGLPIYRLVLRKVSPGK